MDQGTDAERPSAFTTEFDRRARILLGAESDARITAETDVEYGGGCETCEYTYAVVTVAASSGQSRTFEDQLGGSAMQKLFAELDAVEVAR